MKQMVSILLLINKVKKILLKNNNNSKNWIEWKNSYNN